MITWGNIISSNTEIAEKLNTFWSNIVKELNIMVKEDFLCDVSNIKDLVERTIQKYKNHPSTKIIKEAFEKKKKKNFHFTLFHHTPFIRKVLYLSFVAISSLFFMNRQISEYFETIFSKFQCGFRKKHPVYWAW